MSRRPDGSKWRAGVLGATGMVGQRLVKLLADHPWFELTGVAASERSSGKTYAEAARWQLETPIPEAARGLVVKELDTDLDCDFVFSALDSSVAGKAEEDFARAGYPVVSNSKNHRMDPDVPLLLPEVNASHADAIRVHLESRLGRLKIPRLIEIRPRLPRDLSGKLLKRELKEPYWLGRERRI